MFWFFRYHRAIYGWFCKIGMNILMGDRGSTLERVKIPRLGAVVLNPRNYE